MIGFFTVFFILLELNELDIPINKFSVRIWLSNVTDSHLHALPLWGLGRVVGLGGEKMSGKMCNAIV